MKTKIILLICVWMTGCGESKVAEEYAQKMTTVLSTYRTQVDKNIRAEQQSYVDLAKTYDTASVNRLEQELDVTRNQQATAFVDEVKRSTQVAPSTVLSRLQTYGEIDFAEAEKVFTREADAYKKALSGLEDLTVEVTRLEKLNAMLSTLADPRSNIEQLKMLGQFGCEVNRNYKLIDVGKELAALTPQIAAANAALAKLTTDLAAATTDEKKKELATDLAKAKIKAANVEKLNTAANKEKTELSTPCK